MKTVGLIVEYNPLHNGHLYHYEQAKLTTGAEAVVAVMSGNFLQRGEPAVVDKWARTRMALGIGIDLVLELPVTFSTQNAELFAHGAISTLDRTGVVDSICFGSESGDLSGLMAIAQRLKCEPEPFKQELKRKLSEGISYPSAYAQAITRTDGQANGFHALDQPNNILGLNYLLALLRQNSTMQAFTITRQKAGYHQEEITDAKIASATALRKILFEDRKLEAIRPFVPATTFEVLSEEWEAKRCPISWESYSKPLQHALLTQSISQLRSIYEVGEGFEYRLVDKWAESASIHDWIHRLKTKRYTWNRIQRMLLNLFLNRTKQDIEALKPWEGVSYIRVLGSNEKGRKLLAEMRKKAKVPIVTKVSKEPNEMLTWDVRAAQLYALAYSDSDYDAFTRLREFRQFPYLWGLSERR